MASGSGPPAADAVPPLPVVSRRRRVALVVAVAAVLAYVSLLATPGDGVAALGPFGLVRADKYLHAAGYAALGGAVAYALVERRPVVAAVAAAAIAAAYGLCVELLQTGLPRRAFDLGDLAANVVGAAVASVCWVALARLGRRP